MFCWVCDPLLHWRYSFAPLYCISTLPLASLPLPAMFRMLLHHHWTLLCLLILLRTTLCFLAFLEDFVPPHCFSKYITLLLAPLRMSLCLPAPLRMSLCLPVPLRMSLLLPAPLKTSLFILASLRMSLYLLALLRTSLCLPAQLKTSLLHWWGCSFPLLHSAHHFSFLLHGGHCSPL